MEKNHRLFLRNLPIDIDKNHLEKLFGEYGTVTNIDIKEKTQNDGKKIAFLNITTTDWKLNTCFKVAKEKTLGGLAIDVQVAKESYLDRLKREREEVAKAVDAPSLKFAMSHGDCSESQPTQRVNIKLSTSIKSKPTKRKFDFEDTENIRVTEYPATKSTSLPCFLDDPALTAEPIPIKGVLTSSERPATPPSKLSHLSKIADKKVIVQSEIKRLASVKEKRQTFKLHEKLISQALKAVDSTRRNNKVVFSEDIDPSVGYEKNSSAAVVTGHSASLFDDDENLEDQEDWNIDKFQHDERRNVKLKMSLSNPNGDKRFVIDERFLDNDRAKEMEKGATESNSAAAESENETKWQLDILENVLGKPFRARDEKIPGKKQNKMIRYDPTSSRHQNHELVMEKPVMRAKKVKSTNVIAQERTPISVSSEVFYEVSKNLTESLNTQEEFSLLKSFGTATTNDKNSKDDYEAAANDASQKEKWEKNGIEDSFKRESSSDEDAPPYSTPSMDRLTCKRKNGTNDVSDTFFFFTDDQRFCEAEEFFNTRPSTGDDFINVRRQLKQIVRSKIRNNVKKNTRWRNTKVSKQPKIR